MIRPLQLLKEWASESPNDLALLTSEFELSSGELWDTLVRIVEWIRLEGISDRERLGVFVPANLQPSFALALLARGGPCALIGSAIEVSPNSAIQRVIAAGNLPPSINPELVTRFDESALARLAAIEAASVDLQDTTPNDNLWMMFSSGTTGKPKAIIRTAAQTEAFVTPRRIAFAKAKYFSLQPGSLTGAFAALLAAVTVRKPHLAANGAEYNLKLLASRAIEITEGSPFQLNQILESAKQTGEHLPALREIHSSGAPISRDLANALATWFGADVFEGYGSSETSHVYTRYVAGSSGSSAQDVFAEGAEIQAVDDDNQEVVMGELGRIRIRSASMSSGYFGDPDLGPNKGFHDGWFYPGDLGNIHGSTLTIKGREDDLMNVAGRKILAKEVEDLVLTHDGISDVVACTVLDKIAIRQLAIAYVGKPLVDPVAFAHELRIPLGDIMPSVIMRVESIPRLETGKPDRQAVAKALEKQLNRPTLNI